MTGVIDLLKGPASDVATPATGRIRLFANTTTGEPSYKDEAGVVTSLKGADGADGDDGDPGQGVPTGGSAGQVLAKIDGTNYNTQWTTPAATTPTLTTYTASQVGVLADEVVQMNVASANTYTIPTNASVAHPIGKVIEVWQMGAGQTTISDNGGAITILYHADLTLKLKGLNSGCSLRKVATNTWRLIGDMELV